jgi:hypothetical protein
MKSKRLLKAIPALVFFAAGHALPQTAPLEIIGPISVDANPGSSLYESATVTGGAGAYRWQFNGRDFPGAAGFFPEGGACLQLSLTNLQATNAGYYQLIATNSLGSVTSRIARLTVYTNIPPVWAFTLTNGDNVFNTGAKAMKLDTAGNAYVTGWSRTDWPSNDICTLNLSAEGRVIWEATYSAAPKQAYAAALALDEAGNVYLTGSESPNDNSTSTALTLKYDTNGKLLWTARYDGPTGAGADGRAIAVDNSGNAYVTGLSSSAELVTIKYAPNGDLLWVARYPSSGDQNATPLALDKQNNLYVAGVGTTGDYFVIKYDSEGHPGWLASYAPGGDPSAIASLSAIALDSQGDVVVAGNVRSQDDPTSATSTTAKFDVHGKMVWVAAEPSGYAGFGTALALDSAGDCYLTSTAGGPSSDQQGIAAWSYDAAGKLRWKTIHNHENLGASHSVAVASDQDGNAYVAATLDAGLYSEGMLILKFDSHGTREWIGRYGQRGGAVAIGLNAERNFYVAGYASLRVLKFAPPDIPRTRLLLPDVAPDGSVEIRASGESGRFYQIESSQDLIRWDFLSEAVNPTGEFTMVDTNVQPARWRFYRTRKE